MYRRIHEHFEERFTLEITYKWPVPNRVRPPSRGQVVTMENGMTVCLVPYDASWHHAFLQEKQKLAALLKDNIFRIEHIGSTAIPGIRAKPVIDILIAVKKLEAIQKHHIDQIASLGYQYIQDYEQTLPQRRFLVKNDSQQNRTYHIHLVNYKSAWWQRHVLFRDYLRKYFDAAKAYETAKLQLTNAINHQSTALFYRNFIAPFPQLVQEYQTLRAILGDQFTAANQYALAKSPVIEKIAKQAYFDFTIHPAAKLLNRLCGYIPQMVCFDIFKKMFQDSDFSQCYGVTLDDKRIRSMLAEWVDHWDRYRFGPYVWFDRGTNHFVGVGGLKHVNVADQQEIELMYSLMPDYWGRGLAAEIGHFAIDYACHPLGLRDIVCFTTSTNDQSLRVIEKLNFCYEKDFVYKSLPHKLFRLKNSNI